MKHPLRSTRAITALFLTISAGCGGAREVPAHVAAPAEPPPTPSPAATAMPSTEPAATAPPSSPRVVVTCNDCGVKPIPMIRFQYGSALLPADTEAVLREVAEVMKAHPEITLVAVEGHADLDEGRWLKGDVSRRRAEAVRDQLVAKGVEPGRLTVVAYGSTKPLADNATAAGRARNRRVQFRVEEKTQP